MKTNSTKVRFKTNKPFLAKKIFTTLLIIGIIAYVISGMHIISIISLALCVGIPLAVKIGKQPAEGKGFFGKVANFYKTMYRQYVIDYLPTDIKVNDTETTIALHKAEKISFKLSDEIYTIKKDRIAGVLFDDISNDLLIMFQDADIDIFDSSTKKNTRHTKQFDSTICVSIENNCDIPKIMKDFNYPIEKLSEIDDGEQETEDPELLVNKYIKPLVEQKKKMDEEGIDKNDKHQETLVENKSNIVAKEGISI